MTPMLVSNQPVRNNKVKLPCSRKQQELLMDFELTADPLRVYALTITPRHPSTHKPYVHILHCHIL